MLAPIASDIGHGQLGLRSGLRRFDTLLRESESQKHAYTELRGARLMATWAGPSSSIYSATVDETWRGRRLDVVSVLTRAGTLTRVEALADVVAGTYYYDADAAASSTLYVRLADSTSPGTDTTWAIFGWYFGDLRVVHPALGPEKLVNGSLDTLTGWATTGLGASSDASTAADTAVFAEGSGSARIQGTVIPGGYYRLDNDAAAMPTVAGKRYRISALYRTDPANGAQVGPAVGIQQEAGALDNHLLADGRTITTTQTPLALAPTGGEWMRFVFDVIAPGATLQVRLYLLGGTATGYGKVWFDGVSCRRIYRFEEYDPRLSYQSMPPISEGRRGIFFGRWQFGQGSVSLNGDAGYFEGLFQAYDFCRQDVFTRLGGRFPGGGNEILLEDTLTRRWISRRVRADTTKSRAVVELDNPQVILGEKLPKRQRTRESFASLAVADYGKPRPLAFGTVENITPGLLDNTLPVSAPLTYELVDGAVGVNGLHGTVNDVHVYAYLDTQAAAMRDSGRRHELLHDGSAGSEYAFTLSTGQFLVGNALPIEITSANNKIDFNIGGGALLATIPVGIYIAGYDDGGTHIGLAKAIATAMNTAAGVGDIKITIDLTTKKFTISKTAGTLNLLCNTGANKAQGAYETLGFKETDKTGALSYLGDNEVYKTPEAVILRGDTHGFSDDASGTYTGTANALITKPGDILYFLLRQILGVPVDMIDVPSVVTARSGAPSLTVFIGEQIEFGEIVQRIEQSSGIELLWVGEKFSVRLRDDSTPTNVLEVGDREIIENEGWLDQEDLYSSTVVEYTPDPSTGIAPATDPMTWYGTLSRIGRIDKTIRFKTYLPAAASPPAYATDLSQSAAFPRRRFKLLVKGACLNKNSGDKIRITATRYLGRSAAELSLLVRIIHVEHNQQAFSTWVECVEVIAGLW